MQRRMGRGGRGNGSRLPTSLSKRLERSSAIITAASSYGPTDGSLLRNTVSHLPALLLLLVSRGSLGPRFTCEHLHLLLTLLQLLPREVHPPPPPPYRISLPFFQWGQSGTASHRFSASPPTVLIVVWSASNAEPRTISLIVSFSPSSMQRR